ncbi:MAG: hypothetical protein ABFD44_00705 [Anaerolineaceae bacterium]
MKDMNRLEKIRVFLGGLLFAASLAGLLWNFLSAKTLTRTVACAQCARSEDGVGLNQTYTIQVSYPARIRLGETAAIELRLIPPAAMSAKATPEGAQFAAVAILELPHAFLTPNLEARQRLMPGQTMVFEWTAQPDGSAKKLEGNLWLRLNVQPSDGTEIDQLLSVQPLEIPVAALFGLDRSVWRWVGGAGIFMGIVLALPLFDFWFFRRRGQKS